MVGASIATTVTLSEGHDLMLGTRDLINDWIQRRREQYVAKVKEEGREEGREEMREEVNAWYKRQQAAVEKGEPFDEPPLDFNKS